jgi:hypothetical protein
LYALSDGIRRGADWSKSKIVTQGLDIVTHLCETVTHQLMEDLTMTENELREYVRDKLEMHGLAVQKSNTEDWYSLVRPIANEWAYNWPAVRGRDGFVVCGALVDIKRYLDALETHHG